MSMLTLFDLVTLQRNDPFTGLVEDVTTFAPEFSTVPVVARAGTTYDIVSRTALPTAAFRRINDGVTLRQVRLKEADQGNVFPGRSDQCR